MASALVATIGSLQDKRIDHAKPEILEDYMSEMAWKEFCDAVFPECSPESSPESSPRFLKIAEFGLYVFIGFFGRALTFVKENFSSFVYVMVIPCWSFAALFGAFIYCNKREIQKMELSDKYAIYCIIVLFVIFTEFLGFMSLVGFFPQHFKTICLLFLATFFGSLFLVFFGARNIKKRMNDQKITEIQRVLEETSRNHPQLSIYLDNGVGFDKRQKQFIWVSIDATSIEDNQHQISSGQDDAEMRRDVISNDLSGEIV